MNYSVIYDKFIISRRDEEVKLLNSKEYKERHHILPTSLGGGNNIENLIYLTARDHYFAHCCLAKIYSGKMWSALFAIANMSKVDGSAAYFLRGRMVAVAKTKAAEVRSRNMQQLWQSGEFKRNRIYSPLSEVTKNKISVGNKGKKCSEESIKKSCYARRKTAKEFEFQSIKTGQEFKGTQSEFVKFTGIGQSLAACLTREKIKSAKGWILKGNDPNSISNRDPAVRIFTHKEGEIFIGTLYEFRTKYNLDAGVISNLIHGKNRVQSFKGWKYSGKSES